ncbi:M48 family metalloprotease [Candidatus Dependentiae bacterium]|nr:M48 family metalloprotease [Candidatus Dependentiae bacterium]MBU4387744.1 M48 family metalloprotease [Candidatus Dependentiae bacterium]MCG2756336.1 M48 family metalloprotease [Candidatus Dependentiae bacterium]
MNINNIKNKLAMIFCLSIQTIFAAETQTYNIANEINNLKTNDDYVIKYLAANKNVKYYLDKIERTKIITATNHDKFAKRKFISGSWIEGLPSDYDNCVFVDKDKAPFLNAMVEELAAKANLDKPYLFISFSDNKGDSYNAGNMVFSKKLSNITIGYELAKSLSDDELRAVLAHEIGHIVSDSKKISFIEKYLSLNNLTMLFSADLVTAFVFVPLLFTRPINRYNSKAAIYIKSIAVLTPYVLSLIVWLAIRKRLSNLKDEINADKFAIEITKDPKSFLAAMIKMKNDMTEQQNILTQDCELLNKELENLKNTHNNIDHELCESIEILTDSIEANRKTIFEEDTSDHPSFKSRIEFANKEIEKLEFTKQA